MRIPCFKIYYHTDSNGSGLSLLHKIKEAITQKTEHTHLLEDLERTIPPTVLDEWTREVEAWKENSTKPNPLEPHIKGDYD